MTMTLAEFRATARTCTVAEAAEATGYDDETFGNSTAVILYDGLHYLEVNPAFEGGHYLLIENAEHFGSREELERVLYEWAKDEWL